MHPKTATRAEIVKTLAKGDDSKLIIYKMLPTPDFLKKNEKRKYFKDDKKLPRDKYSIEYLWNIGATFDF